MATRYLADVIIDHIAHHKIQQARAPGNIVTLCAKVRFCALLPSAVCNVLMFIHKHLIPFALEEALGKRTYLSVFEVIKTVREVSGHAIPIRVEPRETSG